MAFEEKTALDSSTTTTAVAAKHDNAIDNGGVSAAMKRGSHDGEKGSVSYGGTDEIVVVPGTTLLDVLSKWELVTAWVGLLLVSFTNYLDAVTVGTYNVYALSEYGRLSIEGAMSTIFGVIALAIQGVLATLARELHPFNIIAFSVTTVTLAFILEAASPGVAAFICGHVFYIVGLMKLSTLRHRSFALGAANMPAMISQLGGAKMAEATLNNLGWRWGIGMWCILIPVASIPLLTILYLSKRKTRHARAEAYGGKTGFLPRTLHVWKKLIEGDLFGCALLAAGCAMFFLPIPLEHGGIAKYAEARNVAPTVIGFLVFISFFIWEVKFAPKPLFPARLVQNRNVYGPFLMVLCGNFAMAFVSPYFYVYLMVTSKLSISNATYVTLAPWLTNAFVQIVYGAIVSWTKRPKWLLVATSGLLLVATGVQYAHRDPHTQLAGLVASQVVAGFGFGGLLTAIVQAQARSSVEDVPALVAGYIIVSNFGASVASAVVGGIWTTTLIDNLQNRLPEALKNQARTIMGDLTVIQSYDWDSPEREAINMAHKDTWTRILLGAIVAAALTFACGFIGEDVDLGAIDEERQLEKMQAQDDKLEGKLENKA
ncbi:major facilitator superfamily domain-containing protein [Plectosphaerella plurivora]|uniref:Major facilitator superfamily domain-containing protein n=1 Tax=Plectosphaerella plurivora TaxID=936078 RepID=A0A9P8VI78_9PEZI|nr:major facilitator superfamily domain-containing protein [Plectosphaerella plurivora]